MWLKCDVRIEFYDANGGFLRHNIKRNTSVLLETSEGSKGHIVIPLSPKEFICPLNAKFISHTSRIAEGRAGVSFPAGRYQVMFSGCDSMEVSIFMNALLKLAAKDGKQCDVKLKSIKPPTRPLAIGKQMFGPGAAAFLPTPLSITSNREQLKRVTNDMKNNKPVISSNIPKKRANWNDTHTPPPKPAGKTLKSIQAGSLLSDCQKMVLKLVKEGKSVMFTGGAGTGKSFLLRTILKESNPITTQATASTGISAHQIGGVTIHSMSGCGGFSLPLEAMISRASRGKTGDRWRRTKMLILDEVSMISADMFDKLEAVARAVRRNQRPFGGIQLVLSGDFFQLPPVVKNDKDMSFCFEAKSWKNCIEDCVELQTVFRQDDMEFIDALNDIRVGTRSNRAHKLIEDSSNNVFDDDGILPTKLYPRRQTVDEENEAALESLEAEVVEFRARDRGSTENIEKMNQICQARDIVKLKIGAQVVLIKNLDVTSGLQNGARGVIVRFTPSMGLPVVRFVSGEEHAISMISWPLMSDGLEIASRLQLPLDLAWALSIHKSIGMTLDRAEVSLSGIFESGQTYVALSRVRSPKDLRIINADIESIRAHPKVLKFYRNEVKKAKSYRIPPPNNAPIQLPQPKQPARKVLFGIDSQAVIPTAQTAQPILNTSQRMKQSTVPQIFNQVVKSPRRRMEWRKKELEKDKENMNENTASVNVLV